MLQMPLESACFREELELHDSFFVGGRGLNPDFAYINALPLPTEISSQ